MIPYKGGAFFLGFQYRISDQDKLYLGFLINENSGIPQVIAKITLKDIFTDRKPTNYEFVAREDLGIRI